MNKLNLKLKLNKIYERQLLMRRKLWDIEETVNAIEKLHKDNYDAIDHPHKKHVSKEDLAAGTFLGDYPSMIKGAVTSYRQKSGLQTYKKMVK